MTQTPSVGRIVHYRSHGTPVREDGTQAYTGECRAAVVTALPDVQIPEGSVVSLCVLNPSGMFFHEAVVQGAEDQGGSWHWPTRV